MILQSIQNLEKFNTKISKTIQKLRKTISALSEEKKISQCAYCGAVENKNKDKSYTDYGIGIIRHPPFSHGACPICFKKEMDKIK